MTTVKKLKVSLDDKIYDVEVRPNLAERNQFLVLIDGQELPVYVPDSSEPGHLEWMVVKHRPYELVFSQDLDWLISAGGMHRVEIHAGGEPTTRPLSGDGRVKAPIPGLITRVFVEPGATVQAGQRLLVLEAMKMENEVRAPRGGVVQQVNVHPGQSVNLSEVMVEIG